MLDRTPIPIRVPSNGSLPYYTSGLDAACARTVSSRGRKGPSCLSKRSFFDGHSSGSEAIVTGKPSKKDFRATKGAIDGGSGEGTAKAANEAGSKSTTDHSEASLVKRKDTHGDVEDAIDNETRSTKKQRSEGLSPETPRDRKILSGRADSGGTRTSSAIVTSPRHSTEPLIQLVDSSPKTAEAVLTLFRRSGRYPAVGDHVDAKEFNRVDFEKAFDDWFLRRSEQLGDKTVPVPYTGQAQSASELDVLFFAKAHGTKMLSFLNLELKNIDAYKFWKSVARGVGEEKE